MVWLSLVLLQTELTFKPMVAAALPSVCCSLLKPQSALMLTMLVNKLGPAGEPRSPPTCSWPGVLSVLVSAVT